MKKSFKKLTDKEAKDFSDDFFDFMDSHKLDNVNPRDFFTIIMAVMVSTARNSIGSEREATKDILDMLADTWECTATRPKEPPKM